MVRLKTSRRQAVRQARVCHDAFVPVPAFDHAAITVVDGPVLDPDP
jgi:hypothetical protein